MKFHAIHRLYEERLARSTRPYLARGANVGRCIRCMLVRRCCVCEKSVMQKTQAAFLLLMYDDEVLKPSNTGRLIADIVQDTYAYIWSRTDLDPAMLSLLQDVQWQPFVVFPAQYAEPSRVVSQVEIEEGKRPLFIIIDGTWREAKKIFRKSRWLDQYPVLSFSPSNKSKYLVREAQGENQLATAEIAAEVLKLAGEVNVSEQLDVWFDVFREHYLVGKMQRPLPENGALFDYQQKVNQIITK